MRHHLLALGLILLCGLASYFNTFQNGFVYDDSAIIVNSTAIKTLNLQRIYQENPARFVGTLSFALTYAFFGLNVFGYHLTSFTIHILNAFLVYSLVYLLVLRSKHTRIVALFTSLLFVSHPLQTQAVSYLSQRYTSLCAFFYLLTLVLYIFGQSKKLYLILISFVTLLLALYTKESAYTFPFVLLLVDIGIQPHRKQLKKRLILIGCYFVIALSILLYSRIIPVLYSHHVNSDSVSLESITVVGNVATSTQHYLLTQPQVVITYLKLLFMPIGQNLDHDFPLVTSLFQWSFILPVLMLLVLLCMALILRKKYPYILWGLLFFFITISVESSFIPLADVIAEHRTYLPSVGLFIAVVSFLWNGPLLKRDYVKKIVLSTFVIVCIIMTVFRNFVWVDDVSLYRDIVSKSPRKAKPLANLGSALLSQNRLDEALKYLQLALELDKTQAYVYNNIGVIYLRRQNNEQAMEYYKKALQVEPGYPNAGNNIGELYLSTNQIELAQSAYKNVLAYHEFDLAALNGYGISLYLAGKKEEGIKTIQKALQLNPDFQPAIQALREIEKREKGFRKN